MTIPTPSAPKDSAALSTGHDLLRILVVDDSAIIRGLITRTLQAEKNFKVVGTAANGQIALDTLRSSPADVIILDIEMPVMDGLTAIPQLKAIDPGVQIIMASTLTQKNADISLKAMSLGATDYIPKPSAERDLSGVAAEFNRDLIEKIKVLGALARRRGVRRPAGAEPLKTAPEPDKKKIVLRPAPVLKPDIIAIGSSTGGPQALFEVIKEMGGTLSQPIVITQHMPPTFTTILAEHISRQCSVSCVEAKEGMVLQAGHYYLAPGDFHLLIVKKPEGPTIHLTKDPAENFCRPAVDPMLRSLVEVYGKKILSVILTGMGQDGMKGCESVTHAGGSVIAQDEATSVVWGMPAAVANAGLCSSVLPVKDIGPAVRKISAGAGL